jgi:fatty-acyl-CoA synthase
VPNMPALTDITAKGAELRPRKIALRDLGSGQAVTYAELEDHASRTAGMLSTSGVTAGDRVAVLCRNRIEFFELLFACGKLAAVLVPLNWRMPEAELRPLIVGSAPKVLLCGAEDRATARALAASEQVPLIDLDDAGSSGYVARRTAAAPRSGRHWWRHDETWYLLYTSGTTGTPKAVIQTYGMALVNYLNIGRAIDLVSDDVTLNFLPLFHTAGINLHTLPTLIAGGTVLVLPGFEPEPIARLLRAGELTTFFAVPAVYQQLSLMPDFGHWDLRRVRHWGCGGAPLPDILVRQFGARGARVCNGFGMTETGPTAFLVDTDAAADKIGSVGKPQLLCAARIVDPSGADVATDATGELWLSGPGITPGYWNAPEATQAAFSPDGWLRSGDLARRDRDGYYYIVGRSKDMYISGGENVYPAEVENVLAQHPAILEAAVVGMPDAKWGEVGCAFILPRPGADLPDAATLTAFCREHLAAYKVPKAYVGVTDFPRTAAGKIQKHLIARPESAPR